METINISLDKNQFIKIINGLEEKDKLEIYFELRKTLFLQRFNKLLQSAKTNELSLEEITREVESVRKSRYEKGKQVS